MKMWRTLGLVTLVASSTVTGSAADRGQVLFEDAAEATGLNFTHFNGMSGGFTLPEITGSGAAVFDYDGDGDLDVYLVQGHLIGPGATLADALVPWPGPGEPRDRLFRNDLARLPNGSLEMRFTDVTEASGIDSSGYGMGAAAADYDNDGDVDLYVTNDGSNTLYRNEGDGTFRDVTDSAGADDPRWSTSAAWLDYDADGHLDLYVANYVDFRSNQEVTCYNNSSARDYCGPKAYPSVPDRLFRNLGDGRFENATTQVGMGQEFGAGLGVVGADFDGDTHLDIYVANDGDENQLWINSGSGSFLNAGLWAGAAFNQAGRPEASMGVDAGDFDGDGDEDLFMTHIMMETNTLFENLGEGLFADQTIQTGLANASQGMTGFGTSWFDYDNDGWLDILVLNGAVLVIEELARGGDPYPLGLPNQLFRNTGRATFDEVSGQAGPAFEKRGVSRGAAFGDIDNDGDTDVVVLNNNGPAQLLLNEVGATRHWLGLELRGADHDRDMLGARVAVELPDGRVLWRRVRTDGSYCSSNDPRVLVGLGEWSQVRSVQVQWPGGGTETWHDLDADRYVRLREGTSSGPGASPVLRAAGPPTPPTVASASRPTRPAEGSPARPPGAPPADAPDPPPAAHGAIEAPRAGLGIVRLPDVAALEPAVAEQLRQAQAELERLLADPSAADIDLARAYGLLGKLYHAYELPDSALDCYENAHALAPGELQWVYLRGDVRRLQGQTDAALEDYEKSREMAGTSLACMVRMGEALLQAGRLEEAKTAYNQALALDPGSPAAQAGRGEVAVAMNENAEAITFLKAALDAVPEANSLHYQLALAYRGLGRMPEARSHMARRGSVGVGVPDPLVDELQTLVLGERVHLLRGRRAFSAGAYRDAAIAFRQAVEAAPGSVRARVNLGSALGEMGDTDGAIEQFRAAIRLAPGNHAANFNLGALLQGRGQFAGAVPPFQAALQADPDDAEAHLHLGQCLSALGRPEEAIPHFLAARNHEPTAEASVLGHARILVAAEDYQAALELLEEAHRRMPLQGQTAHALARLLAACPDPALRDGGRALDLALRVFKASPVVGHAETVAQALAQSGRCDDALDWQQRAVDSLPEDSGPRRQRMESRLEHYESGPPCRP